MIILATSLLRTTNVNIKNDLKIVQLAGLKNNKKLARELSLWIAAGICWARGAEPWWPKWSKRHFEFVAIIHSKLHL